LRCAVAAAALLDERDARRTAPRTSFGLESAAAQPRRRSKPIALRKGAEPELHSILYFNMGRNRRRPKRFAYEGK
jgi:hypothetical protein